MPRLTSPHLASPHLASPRLAPPQNEILREQQRAALEKEEAQAAVRDADALAREVRKTCEVRKTSLKLAPALASKPRPSNRQSLEPERPASPAQSMVSMMAAALGRARDAPQPAI